MDLLKKELERKKKALKEAKASKDVALVAGGRYLKAGALRRREEEEEEANQMKRKKERSQSQSIKRPRTDSNTNASTSDAAVLADKDKPLDAENNGPEHAGELRQLSPSEVTRQFRSLGLPVRLFGERTILGDSSEDAQRLSRLARALAERKETLASLSAQDEFRLGRGFGIRNPFLGKDSKAGGAHVEPIQARVDDAENPEPANADPGDDGDDPKDAHKRIYKYFKGLLKEWEEELNLRPEEVRRSLAGRNEAKTVKQCKDYIRPLFKLCKNRRLDEGIVTNLASIVDFCEQGEFVRANDKYMDIAIGRAAWPIGVTMVGIHARTGREKIESGNVAHVMNSELQRKYLTSVKRLMTYAQKKRADVDPSKKVMN